MVILGLPRYGFEHILKTTSSLVRYCLEQGTPADTLEYWEQAYCGIYIAVEGAHCVACNIQARYGQAIRIKNTAALIILQAAASTCNAYSMKRAVVGWGVYRRHPERILVEVKIGSACNQGAVTVKCRSKDI